MQWALAHLKMWSTNVFYILYMIAKCTYMIICKKDLALNKLQ